MWGVNLLVDEIVQKLFNVFWENDFFQVLLSVNIVNYDIKWFEDGVDLFILEEYFQYIEKFCKDFYDILIWMIDKGIEEKEIFGVRDVFVEEVFQYGLFCQKKCKLFYGCKEFLEVLKNVLVNYEN